MNLIFFCAGVAVGMVAILTMMAIDSIRADQRFQKSDPEGLKLPGLEKLTEALRRCLKALSDSPAPTDSMTTIILDGQKLVRRSPIEPSEPWPSPPVARPNPAARNYMPGFSPSPPPEEPKIEFFQGIY